MKLKITIMLFVSVFSFYENHAQSFQFAKGIGGTDDDYGHAITNDKQGNIFTTGSFKGTVDFDPGVATFNLTSKGNSDIFISKLNTNGDFIWAISMGGLNSDAAYSIAIDSLGNIYTTGFFSTTADFDPSPVVNNLTTSGMQDIFLSKLDSNGNFIWAKKMGGDQNDYAYSISVNKSAEVHITGAFHDTADFDPGATTFLLNSFGGTADAFVSKYDSSGNLLWAKKMGGGNADVGWAIATDLNGNVYTTGHYQDTVDFNPGAGINLLYTNTTYTEIFISKLDALGNFIWVKQLGGNDSDYPSAITIDDNNNVLSTGYFVNSGDFDPSSASYTLSSSPGNATMFISKLTSAGDFIWAKAMGGLGSDRGHSIRTDHNGNIITTGYFTNTADFDPGSNTFDLVSKGGKDIFISKLDSSGNFISAFQMGGVAEDIGTSICTDSTGNIYTTGNYNETCDFDPNSSLFNLISLGNNDIFIHKMGNTNVGISENIKLEEVILYPNPTNEMLYVRVLDNRKTNMQLYTQLGILVKETSVETSTEINTSNLPSGLYFIRFTQLNQAITSKKIFINH